MIKFNNWYHYTDMWALISCEISCTDLTEEEEEYLLKNKLDSLVVSISLCANDDNGCIDADEDGSLNFNIKLHSFSNDENDYIFQKEYKRLNKDSLEEVNSILRSHNIEEIDICVHQFLDYLCQDNWLKYCSVC